LLEQLAAVAGAEGPDHSQQMIAATQQLLENRLGADGYAFAKVDPVQARRRRRSRHDVSHRSGQAVRAASYSPA
jgi:hypothetical protein